MDAVYLLGASLVARQSAQPQSVCLGQVSLAEAEIHGCRPGWLAKAWARGWRQAQPGPQKPCPALVRSVPESEPDRPRQAMAKPVAQPAADPGSREAGFFRAARFLEGVHLKLQFLLILGYSGIAD